MISDQSRSQTSSIPNKSVPALKSVAPPTANPASLAVVPRADQTQTATTSLGQVRNTTPGDAAGPKQPVLQSQGTEAAKNRGTILTEPGEIMSHELGRVEGAKAKYAALPGEQRTHFDKLFLSQVVDGTEVSTEPKKHGGFGAHISQQAKMTEQERATLAEQNKGTAARRNLLGLLAGDKLTAKDSAGDTMLENLSNLREQPVAEGLNREELLRGVLQDTAFQPGQSGNVAKGELNKAVAQEKPADYARVIRELASPDGKAKLGSSELEGKPPSEPAERRGLGFGPSESSRLFQNSIDETTAREQLFKVEVSENSEKRAAFDRLSATDQKKFQVVFQDTIASGDYPKMPQMLNTGGMGGTPSVGTIGGMAPQQTEEHKTAMADFTAQSQAIQSGKLARTGLTSLLQKGTLSNKDSQGDSLMNNLDSIRRQEMATENGHTLNGKEVMSELINQIDDPGSIRQNNKGTCTVTTVEHLLATRQPSEYARVVGELTGNSGSVKLQDGTTVPREKGIVTPDDSGRTNTSRIFQATMMEYGNGAEIDYRNVEDGHYRVSDGEPLLNSDGKVRSGLSTEDWGKVSNSVMGTDSKVHEGTLWGGKRDEVQSTITQALNDGRAIQVGMKWSTDGESKHGYHALSMTGQDDEYVYLRNPWGSGDQGSTDSSKTVAREVLRPQQDQKRPGFVGHGGFGMVDSRPVADPSLSSGEGGSIRVKKDEFYSKLSNFLVEETPQKESPAWYDRFNPFE